MTSAVTACDMHKIQLMKAVDEIQKQHLIDVVGLNCYQVLALQLVGLILF